VTPHKKRDLTMNSPSQIVRDATGAVADLVTGIVKASRKSKAAPPAPTEPDKMPPPSATKQARLIEMLTRPGAATLTELVQATGWQAHSVRGALSGTLKKRLGLAVTTEMVEGRGRVYRISGKA
jgi:Protein of unknown function (DUF3489)